MNSAPPVSRFRALLNLAGPGFFPLGLFARLPVAMNIVGILTLVTAVSHSYATAGFAAGAAGIGSAVGAPVLGVLADRLRQRWVMSGAAVVNAALTLAFLLTAWKMSGAQETLDAAASLPLIILAFFIGASTPQVGPLARVRWMAMTRTLRQPAAGRALDTALSYEGTVDELTFVLGPALVGLLAAAVAAWLPLLIAAILTVILVILFAFHPSERFVPAGSTGNRTPGVPAAPAARTWLKLAWPILGMVSMGVFFGSTQNSLSAFGAAVAPDAGGADLVGLLYAAMGVGSAATALSVAYWSPRFSLRGRWLVCSALLATLSVLFLLPGTLGTMLVVLLLVGLAVGPSMVTMFAIAGNAAPLRWLGTVMTLLASGIVAGTALGNAVAGPLAQSGGYHAAFGTPIGAAVAMVLFAAASFFVNRGSGKPADVSEPAARP